jgi:prevent-host-death family protein
MKIVPAAKFKAQCLALLERVDPDGIIITKHGRPVAKVVPIGRPPTHLIGSLKGKLKIKGDIFSTGLRWDAESRHPRSDPRARRRSQRG